MTFIMVIMKSMFKHQDLQMFILKLMFFYPLKVVGRGRETQLRVICSVFLVLFQMKLVAIAEIEPGNTKFKMAAIQNDISYEIVNLFI